MTYNSSYSDEQVSIAIPFGGCSYVYYSNTVNHRYIALPHNISDLNNVFCTPLNRCGLLCRDCIDRFGPSILSLPLAMLVQIPQRTTTVGCYTSYQNLFLQLCFTLYSSHIADPNHICTNELLFHVQPNSGNFLNFSQGFLGTLMVELNLTSRTMFIIILTCYRFWNLGFLRFLIPPFCMSQDLKNIHVLALHYVSAFYPLLLIFLTYACVELH